MGFKKYEGSTWQAINPKKLKGIPYTGALPATLTGTKAGYLHRYKIYGNTEQVGTPTPENPIMPSECGELETTGVHAGQYKLHLTSAGRGVDIYIGESQATRRIRKLVLTGNETGTWYRNAALPYGNAYFNASIFNNYKSNSGIGYCTHYPLATTTRATVGVYFGSGVSFITDFSEGLDTAEKWKTYLEQQYANGTPVTVWYAIAEPETSTLNEPLRKIGNYADTIDSTQANVQIPTSAGSTTISWAGEGLAPSEFDSIQEWVDIPTYTYTNGAWVADN